MVPMRIMDNIMGDWFNDQDSMHARGTDGIPSTLKTIAAHYTACHPASPYRFRPFGNQGIIRLKDYRYHADLAAIFPEAPLESFVYVWGKYFAKSAGVLKFSLFPYGPAKVYMNGVQIASSNIFTERYIGSSIPIDLPLTTGWNHLVIRFSRTRAGFGGAFGTWLGKLDYYFLKPLSECEDQEGFVYTQPMAFPLPAIPCGDVACQVSEDIWESNTHWDAMAQSKGSFGRIFGLPPGGIALARTQVRIPRGMPVACRLSGSTQGLMRLMVGTAVLYDQNQGGVVGQTRELSPGTYPVVVVSGCPMGTWDLQVSLVDPVSNEPLEFENPLLSAKSPYVWLYGGLFASEEAALEGQSDFDPDQLIQTSEGPSYWRLDFPGGWVRQYNENELYGHWSYPLGVTLSGLVETSRTLVDKTFCQTLGDYVASHVRKSIGTFPYAMWDKEHLGGATAVHHLLTSIDSLDDCGSFGSCVMEVARDHDAGPFRPIVDYIADYIAHRQIRLPDGTFFRKNLMHTFHEDTMWADDLYMSVPFLCRYSQLSGDGSYLDDAARQFLGFKKHLYMEDKQVMSHVYDFKREMATGVPWGRGNGWTLFSLSELLGVLSQEHPLYSRLLEFFQELCAGYLRLQDAHGMWHQVLDMPRSYPETSCTAMFIYAFCKGIRFGWLEDPTPYRQACIKAWDALERHAIDWQGNIHGVCRGSEFSFSPVYYAEELTPRLNDTHGIGIVLLAGVEMLRMKKWISAL